MEKYLVRVWIEDFVVEAETKEQAEQTACELIDQGERCPDAEYAEVQKQFINGKWEFI